MFVGVSRKFRKGDKQWREHMEHYRLDYLAELRSIDSLVNPYTSDHGPVECTPETLEQVFADLPIPRPYPYNEYYLLAIDLLAKPEYAARLPAGWKLLGYDVADENRTSSLHAYARWASTILKEYLLKGFVMDDERLKNPDGRPDYFDEMLERIRDIWASEKRFYQKVRDLFALTRERGS